MPLYKHIAPLPGKTSHGGARGGAHGEHVTLRRTAFHGTHGITRRRTASHSATQRRTLRTRRRTASHGGAHGVLSAYRLQAFGHRYASLC
eukprot:gene8855-biopygen1840